MFGVDVSLFQWPIDFTALAANTPSVDFAYIKVSEGQGRKEPMAARQANGFAGINVPFGFYHFTHLSQNSDPKVEAANFVAAMEALIDQGIQPTLIPAIDIEDTYRASDGKSYSVLNGLTFSKAIAWINTFIATMNAAGYADFLIYGGPGYFGQYLNQDHGLGKYPLWLAQYTKGEPTIIKGWTEFAVWQYEEGPAGCIAGIANKVDLNRADSLEPFSIPSLT